MTYLNKGILQNKYLIGTSGYLNDNANSSIGGIMPVPFINDAVKGYEGATGYLKFVEEVSKKLPSYFFIYVPSFMNISNLPHSERYNFTVQVPVFINLGKEYPFIKPNKKTTLASN